jgi:hypothetical protein
MKLYKVQVKINIVIRARDEAHAEAQTASIIRDGDCECDTITVFTASELTSARSLPRNWTRKNHPWGESDPQGRTIGEILSAHLSETTQ